MNDEDRFLAFLGGAKIEVGDNAEVHQQQFKGPVNGTTYTFFGAKDHYAEFIFDEEGKSMGYEIGG